MFVQSLRASVVILLGFTALFGFIYPGVVTGISKLVFPIQAEGSLIKTADDKIAGSSLIGQSFSDPKYFWGRLSATGPVPYNAAASSGSNLGAAAPNLETVVKCRIKALQDADLENKIAIPVDLVTASGSGLDPDISVEAVKYQAARVAKARGLNPEHVRGLIEQHTQGRQFGILGEPRINVLLLNRALDGISVK